MTPSEFDEYTRFYKAICKTPDFIGSYYDETTSAYVDEGHDALTAGLWASDIDTHINIQISRSFPSDTSGLILDAGCGVGRYAKRVAELFPSARLIGLTVSQFQIEEAQRLGNTHERIEYRQGSYDDLSFLEDESLSGAYFFQSLGYRPLTETFEALAPKLKPGAFVSIVDMSSLDDMDINDVACIRNMQESWYYACFPLDYQITAARLFGLEPVVINRNLNLFLDWRPWNDLIKNSLGEHHRPTGNDGSLKVTETIYVKTKLDKKHARA